MFFPVQQIENLKEGNVRFEKRDNSSERGKICSSALIIRDATKGNQSFLSALSEYSRVEVIKIFTYPRPSEISLPSIPFVFLFLFSLSLFKQIFFEYRYATLFLSSGRLSKASTITERMDSQRGGISPYARQTMSRKIEGVLANSQPTSSSIHVVKLVRDESLFFTIEGTDIFFELEFVSAKMKIF